MQLWDDDKFRGIAMRGFPEPMVGTLRQGCSPEPNHSCRELIERGRMAHCADMAAVDRFLDQGAVRIVPITAESRAFERYVKGRHRTALTLGDCFAYAYARKLDLPILFKGEDFPLTDVAVA